MDMEKEKNMPIDNKSESKDKKKKPKRWIYIIMIVVIILIEAALEKFWTVNPKTFYSISYDIKAILGWIIALVVVYPALRFFYVRNKIAILITGLLIITFLVISSYIVYKDNKCRDFANRKVTELKAKIGNEKIWYYDSGAWQRYYDDCSHGDWLKL